MAYILGLLVLLLVPVSSAAQVPPVPPVVQVPSLVVDRAALPDLGTVNVPLPANLDGDAVTREWVQSQYAQDGHFEIRGIALRAGALCTGGWVRPFQVALAHLVPGDMLLVGMVLGPLDAGRDGYVVVGVRGYYEIPIPYGC